MSLDKDNPSEIKAFLKACSTQPGVYQMYSDEQVVLYVGKAKNLAKRLSSYFNKTNISLKTKALVKQIASITTIVTNTEAEALILECNLIKQFKPKYNILLRDDKSYPYICLSKHNYSRLYLYRGKRTNDTQCYGPYPNSSAAKQTIKLLQQVFLLRTCTDNYFNNRVRPCLLYQIGRCSAPCVTHISVTDYAEYIKNAKLFLEGRSQELISTIVTKMDHSSQVQDYELAAKFRDQIKKLKEVFTQQYVAGASHKATDVIAFVTTGGLFAISILQFRNGTLLGSKEYLDKILLDCTQEDELEEVLLSSLTQYYLDLTANDTGKPELDEIIINSKLSADSKALLNDIVNISYLKKTDENEHKEITIITSPRAGRLKWLELAIKNARDLLDKRIKNVAIYENQFLLLAKELMLTKMPNYIECFDVSHTFGDQTVASCVVYTSAGPDKTKYRRYNIKKLTKGNDLAAMQEALMRRYKKMLESNQQLPEFILIDGGKNQLNIAKKVFEDLNIDLKSVNIKIYGLCKGEGRKAANDKLISAASMEEIGLPKQSGAMHLLQQIRDEAHRFAIVGHRAKRGREHMHSLLEDVPGIGAKRRQTLLKHFGGWREIVNASLDQLAAAPGISRAMAQIIYDYLHSERN